MEPCGYVEINTSVDLPRPTDAVPLTIRDNNSGEILWKGRMDRPVSFPVYYRLTDIYLEFGSRYDCDFSDTVEAGQSYRLVIRPYSVKTVFFKKELHWKRHLKIAEIYDDYYDDDVYNYNSRDDDDYDY